MERIVYASPALKSGIVIWWVYWKEPTCRLHLLYGFDSFRMPWLRSSKHKTKYNLRRTSNSEGTDGRLVPRFRLCCNGLAGPSICLALYPENEYVTFKPIETPLFPPSLLHLCQNPVVDAIQAAAAFWSSRQHHVTIRDCLSAYLRGVAPVARNGSPLAAVTADNSRAR